MKADYLFAAIIGGLTVIQVISDPTFTVIGQGIEIFCLLITILLKQGTIVVLKRKLGVE